MAGYWVLVGLLLYGGVDVSGQVSGRQAVQTSDRISLVTEAVDEAKRIAIPGSVPLMASRAVDRGTVPDSMPADRILVLLRRSPEQEARLRSTIESLHDRNSANFHKWLTPSEFGAEWGASDADIEAVTRWLRTHGFEVKGATAGRTAIEFSGTAGQIREAFHTSVHQYEMDGQTHHANIADPQIPAALATVVSGLTTLNDFHPRSMAVKGPRGVFDASTHKFHADLTSSSSFGDYLFVGPADAATIYNTPNKVLNPGATGSTVDGTGVKIGILGDSNIAPSQFANYRKLFGLPASTPTVVIDGPTDPGVNGDAVEAYLDTEVAGGLAPGAKIYLYTAANTNSDYGLNLATVRAVNDNVVDVLSISFGQCEAGLAYPGNQFYESMWEQAAAQGISVTVSSGDSGTGGCDDQNTETAATYGLQVNGIASTPFDIAVGGTDFAVLAGPNGDGGDFGKYVSTVNAAGTGRSAIGYIPEVPWNDTFLNFPPGPISTTKPFPKPDANIVASGGGRSNCSQGYFDGGKPYCVGGYPKPSWQSATGVPADKARDIPDVSLFAANGFFGASWGICTDKDEDSNGHPIADCTPGSNGLPAGEFYIYGVGGTSASAPAFAGILALVKQATGERQGQADYVLYNLARNKAASIHDVISGNNSVPCVAGSADCPKNSVGANYLKGFNARAGYDLASGLGSVNATELIEGWVNVGLTSTATRLTLTPTSIEHGEVVNADAVVTANLGGAASGDVALSAFANPPTFKLGSAIGTYSLFTTGSEAGSTGLVDINHLPGGTYKVTATYGGSADFSGSVSAPVEVTVAPEASTTAIIVSAYDPATTSLSSKVQYGYYLGIAAQPYGKRSPVVNGAVEPDGTATGMVTFAANGKALEKAYLDSRGLASYSITLGNMLNAGSYAVSVAYTGDNSLLANTVSETVTILKAPTKLSLSAGASAYNGHPVTFTARMGSDSKGIAPTGMMALEDGSRIVAEVPVVGVGASDTTTATATATISTSDLPLGENHLVAVYLGDVNYETATSNQVEVTGRPYFTIADISVSLPSEHSTAAPYMRTTSVGGYSGTIDFTCELEGSNSETFPPDCALYPATSAALEAGKTVSPQVLIFGKGTRLPKGITIGSNGTVQGSGPGGRGLLGLGAGGAALACCLLFGIPGRRKGWKSILTMLLLLGTVTGFSACGGSRKMISAGEYRFKVVGTDSVDKTITATATITVKVF